MAFTYSVMLANSYQKMPSLPKEGAAKHKLIAEFHSTTFIIDKHGSGYLGMAGYFSVQRKKWSKPTTFQTTLHWHKTVTGSNQLL